MIGGDQWSAAAADAVVCNHAATAGRVGKDRGIARSEEGCSFADDEGNACAKLEWAAKKCIVGAVLREQHAPAFTAMVDGRLDASGVQLGFVGASQGVHAGLVNRRQMGVERSADRRNHRLGDRARVLGGEQGEDGEGDEKHRKGSKIHLRVLSFLRTGRSAAENDGGTVPGAAWEERTDPNCLFRTETRAEHPWRPN